MNGALLLIVLFSLGGALFLTTSARRAANRPATHAAVAVALALVAAALMLANIIILD